MSKSVITDSILKDIADAIRAKTGGTETMTPAEMAAEIEAIPAGGGATEPYAEHTLLYSDAADVTTDAYIVAASLHGYNNVPTHAFNATNITSITIPAAVVAISGEAFMSCTRLASITFPASLARIGSSAFRWCSALTNVWIPSVKTIETNAFLQCTGLAVVKIGHAETIFTTAFGSCSKLKNIYVGWSEGEVAGAPWGATNATIHYDTVFDANGDPIE